jgi:hypothetical protein
MLTPLRTKMFDKLYTGHIIRPKAAGGSTTLNANAAADATALTLTATASFGDTDPVLVGAGEDRELVVQTGAPAGQVITVVAPGLKRAHVSTEPVLEGVAFDLGAISATQLDESVESAPIPDDTRRNPEGTLIGHAVLGPRLSVQGYSPWLFALLTGIPIQNVLGAATQADPTQLHTDGDELGLEDSHLVLTSMLSDGTYLREEYDACGHDYSGLQIPLGQGKPTELAAKFVASNNKQILTSLPSYAVDTTYRASKGLQLETLEEISLFEVDGTGFNTTTTAPIAKGANVVAVASGVSVAAGDWGVIEGGGHKQVVWIESQVALNTTFRTRMAYAFPTGSTLKELKFIQLGGLLKDSSMFKVGGSVRPTVFDNMRIQAGVLPGGTDFMLSVKPTSHTLDMLRRQWALPSSAVNGSVLRFSNLLGTDSPVGWYARCTRKDQKTVILVGSDADNALSELSRALQKDNQQGLAMNFRNKLLTQLLY